MKIYFEPENGPVVIWEGIPDDQLHHFLNVTKCAKHFDVNVNNVHSRINRGMDVLLALATE